MRRTYVIEDDCRWEESVSPCTCVFYTTDDFFLFFFFFLDKRFSGSAHALKCLLLAEERYLYLDKQYLVDRHVPWFQDTSLQIKIQSYSHSADMYFEVLVRESKNRYISFLLPYFKHYLGIVIGCFSERPRNGSKYHKIVTLIIILDYVKVSRYISTIL